MAVKTSVVTVGATPVRLDVQADQDGRPDQWVRLFNSSTLVTVYVGGDNGIAASGQAQGYPLPPGEMTPPIDLLVGSQLWAVAPAAATAVVNVMQVGV